MPHPLRPVSDTEYADILRRLGKSGWREGQRELVSWVLQGHAVLGVLPTGHGKSLCFQVAALLMEGCSLVVSPLIALMQDQVEALLALGIAAGRFDSSLSPTERELLFTRLRAGELRLLYVAPESLENEQLMTILRQIELSIFVVDEAHCVSAWGHSFRPDYLKLPSYYQRLPFRALMAMTATATPRVAQDLREAFGIDPAHCLILPPYRANIDRDFRVSQDKLQDLCAYLSIPEHRPAIIYCRSRRDVESVAAQLQAKGLARVLSYHAGQSADLRAKSQRAFFDNERDCLVATIAFGMGIDKPDVRSVIHYHVPSSPEAYVQESGRAGRDGQEAYSLVLMNAQDAVEIENRIMAEEPDEEGILRCVRWMIPASYRVVSLWELGTQCDVPDEVHQRVLMRIAPAVHAELKGYKYYKARPLFPLSTILDGRDEQELTCLQWLDAHREGEVEEAALAWNCSYAKAMDILKECEASQEWRLEWRQQALLLHRVAEIDARTVAQELVDYYRQRREGSLQRWAQLLEMLQSGDCVNQALHRYFMGENEEELTDCQHCSSCRARGACVLASPSEQPCLWTPPPAQQLPTFAREGQRKRFLLGIAGPDVMRRRLWAHDLYGSATGLSWQDV